VRMVNKVLKVHVVLMFWLCAKDLRYPVSFLGLFSTNCYKQKKGVGEQIRVLLFSALFGISM
jgi:hypothetical protein